MSPPIVGVIGIIILVLVLFSGMPVGFGMFLVGLCGFGFLVSWSSAIRIATIDFFSTFGWYTLTVLPMFIFMGYLASASGVTRKLYRAAYFWVGHLSGGLAIATIVAAAAFGAICGSPGATVATIGIASLPEMKKYKYDPALSAACVATGGVLGIMIPPSVVFIVYGIVTQNSIAALFLAGFLPGIMLVLLFSAVIYLRTLRKPTLGPPGPRVDFKQKLGALSGGMVEVSIIFALVIGSLIAGICTATEAGAVGAVSVLLLALIRRQLHWQGFTSALADTTRTTAMVFIFLAGVTVLGRFLAVSQIPALVASFAGGLAVPRVVIMIGILFIYFIFGCVIDPLPFMLITLPIFYPLIISLGYDPIWFGVIMVCVGGTGGMTPPVGIFVYVIAGIDKDTPITAIFHAIWPFVGAMAVAFALLLAFPQIATFLPNVIMP